jgi:hypothetical protein
MHDNEPGMDSILDSNSPGLEKVRLDRDRGCNAGNVKSYAFKRFDVGVFAVCLCLSVGQVVD